jgi:hypothetical protein
VCSTGSEHTCMHCSLEARDRASCLYLRRRASFEARSLSASATLELYALTVSSSLTDNACKQCSLVFYARLYACLSPEHAKHRALAKG